MDATANQQGRSSLKTIIVAAIGTIIEWFDFTAYVYIAPIISELFFPHESHMASLLATFGIFASGYLMRPLGGIYFGNLGDKIGRKKVLIVTIILMAIPMLITALLPTYQHMGIRATLLLLVARMMQGFSVGGEYTGVLVMVLEHAPGNRRGLFTSFCTFVSGFGVLLSSLTVGLLVYFLSSKQMTEWGWRVPFFIGFVLSLIVLVLQCKMKRSPYFERLQAQRAVARIPLLDAINRHFKGIMVVFCLAGYLGIAYYIAAAFLPTYLTSILYFPYFHAMFVTISIAAVYAFFAPFGGYLSDIFGRKTVLVAGAVLLFVFAYPAFWLLLQGKMWSILLGELILILPISASTASFVTFINELFPTRERYSGVSAGYNVGNAVFGSTAPLIVTFIIDKTHSHISPAFYLMAAALLILFVLKKLPETAKSALRDEE